MVFCLMKMILLLKRRSKKSSRVLKSKAMMPLFRLPFDYFLLFSIVGIWQHGPCNYDNFSSMHKFSFDDEFCTIYLCLVCMHVAFALCNHPLLVVVWIGCRDDKCGIFDGAESKALSM